jgi:hypothetical protein
MGGTVDEQPEVEEQVEQAAEMVAAEPKPRPLAIADRMDLPTLGRLLAASGFFKEGNQNVGAAQAAVKVIAGKQLGVGPIASMSNIFVVQNRLMLGYPLVAALVKRSGRYDYRVKKLDNTECVLTFRERADDQTWEDVGDSSFTIQDAMTAGIAQRNGAWKTYPRNLLFARALTNGVRFYCPDIFMGAVFDPNELD